ncbi:GNAT family N-acetyltransferase [Clostridium botulinum]|uniref:GNAT family N-acetyltransferase n=1 Tax=Clostridium botulinum TaxID=1491 RepID=UPI0004D79E3F|nr:GNAT family N-acetyltransferase [Clostridium botulinum]KEI01249.1 GNAT family acetyltransferase [Clostridium botulinum D str. 16868]
MQNINLSNKYNIRKLFKDNEYIVEKLCEKCSDYYILHDGIIPSKQKVKEIFIALPPNKNYKDKFVLGVYKFDELVGIVDIVKNFPTMGEWMLGLIVIDPEERGNGLGKRVHKELVAWAKALGAKSFRVGVIEENYKGIKFWSSLGYKKIKEINMDFIAKTHVVNVMRLKLNNM